VPIYDYVCQSCGERVEVLHGLHASGPERCERCGKGPMRKALTQPAVHFKGSGWAKKDRAASRPKGRSSEEGSKEPEKAAGGSSEGSAEKAPADTPAKTGPTSTAGASTGASGEG
jgi:putative FmdB family regulatory protein